MAETRVKIHLFLRKADLEIGLLKSFPY